MRLWMGAAFGSALIVLAAALLPAGLIGGESASAQTTIDYDIDGDGLIEITYLEHGCNALGPVWCGYRG